MEQTTLWLRVIFPEPCLTKEIQKEVSHLYHSHSIPESLQHLLIDLLLLIMEDSVEKRIMLRNAKILPCLTSILVHCDDSLQFLIAPDLLLLYKHNQTTSYKHSESELFMLAFLL